MLPLFLHFQSLCLCPAPGWGNISTSGDLKGYKRLFARKGVTDSDERLARLNLKVVGVADPNPHAPGIARAREMGIFTTPDFAELYGLPGLNLLIELIGSMDIREQMIGAKPIHVSCIDHRGARLFLDLIRIETEKQQLQRESEEGLGKERDSSQKFIDSLSDKIMALNRHRPIYRVNKSFIKAAGLSETALHEKNVTRRPATLLRALYRRCPYLPL